MNMIWFKGTLACYLAATIIYIVYMFTQKKRLHLIGCSVLALGFALHTVHFIINYIHLGYLPVLNFRQALSLFSWAVAGAYLFTQMKFNIRALGPFVTPFCVIMAIWSMGLHEKTTEIDPIYRSFWLVIHVGTIFIGNGVFAISCVASFMYLLQERQIKTKKPGFFYRRLPSLSTLDSINYYCIMVGFPMLTVGMITGAIYAQVALGTYWRWDPKEVWSLLIWALYAALVHQRLAIGWQGRRAAIMSIIGFGVLLFSFLGVNFLLKGYHSFDILGGVR